MRKQIKNGRQSVILKFIFANFVMGYPCVRPDRQTDIYFINTKKVVMEMRVIYLHA